MSEERSSGETLLQIVGWNTRSIAKKGFEQFIAALDQELSSWNMCAIIEWTKSRIWPNLSREWHKVFLGDPQDGLNRAGFLVHRNFAGTLGDFKSRGRTVALNFDWQGKKFCVFGLSPSVDITHQHFTHNQHIARTSTEVFSTSVAVPVFLLSKCLCSLLVFWDAQCCTDRMFIFGSRKRIASHGSGAHYSDGRRKP